jgi:hypothetical protein
MNSFYRLIASIIKQADEGTPGHSSFRVADNTAVGESPIRTITLDSVPLNESDSILTLAWEGGEKVLEKKGSNDEINHIFQLVSTDLSQISQLSQEEKYDEAKAAMKEVLETYAESTDSPVSTNLPKLHNTQAELDIDADLWKQAAEIKDRKCLECKSPLESNDGSSLYCEKCLDKFTTEERSRLPKAAAQVKMQNVFPSGTIQNLTFESTEDLKEYTDSMKAAQSGKEVPLWEQEGGKKAPESKNELTAPSLSYEDVEKQKEEEQESLKDHMDETIKKELESALQEKAASVFGPEQVELVRVLRENGRNWDEIKKMLTKDFHFDKDAVVIFVDQQRQAAGDEGVEIKKEEPSPLKPPENLVSPETHEKLLEDLKKDKEPVEEVKEIEKVDEAPIVEESAKKSVCPECNGEGDVPAVRGGHVVAISCPSCSGDKHIEHAPKELESAQEEIARADNADIRKVAIASTNLQEGDKVYVDTDTVEWGRVVGPATLLENPVLNRYNILCNVESIRADILVPFKDIFPKKEASKSYPPCPCGHSYDSHKWVSTGNYGEKEICTECNTGEACELPEEFQPKRSSLKAKVASYSLEQLISNKNTLGEVESLRNQGLISDEVYDQYMTEWFKTPRFGEYPQHRKYQTKEKVANEWPSCSVEGCNNKADDAIDGKRYCYTHLWGKSGERAKVASYMNISENEIAKVAADDLNPLQEPIKEVPTMETPEQDVVPFGRRKEDHLAPSAGDWVMVKSDLKDELPAFKAKFVSEYTSNNGTKYATVETEAQDLLEVEMHRVTKITDAKPAAQETDPIATPEIEKPIEQDIPVTQSTEKLTSLTSELKEAAYDPKWLEKIDCEDCRAVSSGHDRRHYCEKHQPNGPYSEVIEDVESSQDELLTIKAEAEQLLKDVESMGKTSYMFFKKGLEKHADDSAFEGNAWVRVWVDQDDVELDKRYAEVLKNPDENARIKALKEIARDIAYNNLHDGVEGASLYADFNVESLVPSEHDRIDWVALANPVDEEEEDRKFEEEMARKYGPDAAIPPQAKSSLEPKVEKKAELSPSTLKNKLMEMGYSENSANYLTSQWQIGNWDRMGTEPQTKLDVQKAVDELSKITSDFEKGISQNKTADEDKCSQCGVNVPRGEGNYKQDKVLCQKCTTPGVFEKKADDPAVEPKTQFKELKKAPAYTDREKAVPASPELDQVLAKLDALEQNLNTLDTAKKQILAKAKEEVAKLEQSAERVQMEKELQESINKSGVLIDALENKVVAWRDKIYTMQTQEVQYVPNLTPKEMLEKIYAKFEGAQKFVESVLNGMLSQAKTVTEKTLVRFPGKKSSLNKEASVIDQWNDELLAALKELSTPL